MNKDHGFHVLHIMHIVNESQNGIANCAPPITVPAPASLSALQPSTKGTFGLDKQRQRRVPTIQRFVEESNKELVV